MHPGDLHVCSTRDLRRPIAVQDKSRERKYIDNYEVGLLTKFHSEHVLKLLT